MKKTVSAAVSSVLALALLGGCGQPQNNKGSGFDPAQMKTVGDVFPYADADGNCQEAYTETKYVYVFDVEGVHYRVYADLPEDVSKELWAIEFDDENRDQKIRDVISPLAIASLDNLSEMEPTQQEMDRNIGRKGQELFDEGWTYWYYNLEDMEAGLNYGPFAYAVTFAYEGEPMVNTDDFDFYEAFSDLEVSSIRLEGIGDASELE